MIPSIQLVRNVELIFWDVNDQTGCLFKYKYDSECEDS